jgi:hypothetical protein
MRPAVVNEYFMLGLVSRRLVLIDKETGGLDGKTVDKKTRPTCRVGNQVNTNLKTDDLKEIRGRHDVFLYTPRSMQDDSARLCYFQIKVMGWAFGRASVDRVSRRHDLNYLNQAYMGSSGTIVYVFDSYFVMHITPPSLLLCPENLSSPMYGSRER